MQVYIIAADTAVVKIGISCEPEKRLRALQTGCPFDLELKHTYYVPSRLAMDVERAIHEALQDKARRGEWFNVEPDDAIEVVKRVAAQMADEYAARARSRADWLTELKATHDVGEYAHSAVNNYRLMAQEPRHRKGFVKASRHVMKLAGHTALTMLQQRALAGNDFRETLRRKPEHLAKAERELAKALRALVDYFIRVEPKEELDKILRMSQSPM